MLQITQKFKLKKNTPNLSFITACEYTLAHFNAYTLFICRSMKNELLSSTPMPSPTPSPPPEVLEVENLASEEPDRIQC